LVGWFSAVGTHSESVEEAIAPLAITASTLTISKIAAPTIRAALDMLIAVSSIR